jgi:hypothetical protein
VLDQVMFTERTVNWPILSGIWRPKEKALMAVLDNLKVCHLIFSNKSLVDIHRKSQTRSDIGERRTE